MISKFRLRRDVFGLDALVGVVQFVHEAPHERLACDVMYPTVVSETPKDTLREELEIHAFVKGPLEWHCV
jgi:hypothetical protein